MSKKILHIGHCDKFIPPFIDFVRENFNFECHEFMLSKGGFEYNIKDYQNIRLIGHGSLARRYHYLQLIIKMHSADKIILHGLFDIKIVKILFYFPWLLKKCYWLVWGGDLYAYQLGERNKSWYKREVFRQRVIKNMGHFVIYTKGDYELAKSWYGASGPLIRCFYYTSNLYSPLLMPREARKTIYILLGNSADPTNNHLEVFDKLRGYKDQDILIYTPLTYGSNAYAKKIINKGTEIFGAKFKPITEHMQKDDYLNFLSQIDIAIFNHNRQQAMGNIRTLLGMGKKVYMKPELTSTKTLHDDGIKTFSLEHFDLNYRFSDSRKNIETIKRIFSVENLKCGLIEIFK